MGHRTNFVVVDDRGWRLHYSHWAANGIYSYLAAGPEAATRFVEAQQRCDPVEDWLDDRWAEGGAVVDHVARQLVFYGNDVLMDVPVKRAFMAVLARTWPGWQVTWAYDGIGDLAAHVGVDRQVVRVPDMDERQMPDDVEDDLSWPCHLLTVRLADGELVADALHRDCHTAWQGPALLDRLPGLDAEPGSRPESAPGSGVPRLDLPEMPASGLHVDVPQRRVGVWLGRWATGLVPALDGLWPGWTVTFWGDGYEEQLDRCGGAVRVPPVDWAAALDELARALEAGRDRDPVRRATEVVARLEEDGRDVVVNPFVAAHEPVTPAATEWRAVRDALAAVRQTFVPRP